MIEVPVTRLRDDPVLPGRAYAGDAGLDLVACERHELGPGERALVGTGIAVAIPAGHAGLVTPRSGLAAKHAISLANTPGTIDPDYRGEVKVLLINLGLEPFVVTRGMRIAQMVVMPVPRVAWAVVDDLPPTPRGDGGFGHTGH